MVQSPTYDDILYPESDGKPIAENTVQYRWIVRLVSNLKRLLKDQTAFVAGDLLWYPVKVDAPPAPSQAPDVMVVLNRPDGDRGSYRQWEEENIAPQVVFEIVSPSNTAVEMAEKQAFYQQHGVLECYVYNPDTDEFWGFVRDRSDQDIMPIFPLRLPWVSPLLGIRFELFDDGLTVFYPTGEPFQDPGEVMDERDQYKQERDRLRAKLRELGIEPDQL
ncbi:MAG: Uma2 family endonuclease [Cyanothece sp. SIO2G6]|nr:Uma2 family endonuclease [Cyanothece sp. SIO2G6]